MTETGTPKFNLEGIRYVVTEPHKIQSDEWRDLQSLAREAYRSAFTGRDATEIDYFVKWNDPVYFRASRLFPAIAQERGELADNQIWRDPVIAIAYDSDAPIGFTTSWNNTSGNAPDWLPEGLKPLWTKVESEAKMYTPPHLKVPKLGGKKYVWFREMVTHPDLWIPEHQPDRPHSGLAHMLGYLSLEMRDPQQVVTAYGLLEAERMMGILHSFGFKATDPEPAEVELFGGGRPTARMQRLVQYAGSILSHIEAMPGAPQAIKDAHISMDRQK